MENVQAVLSYTNGPPHNAYYPDVQYERDANIAARDIEAGLEVHYDQYQSVQSYPSHRLTCEILPAFVYASQTGSGTGLAKHPDED